MGLYSLPEGCVMPTCTKIDPLADVRQLPRPGTTSLFRHLRCGPRLCFSGGAPPCFDLYRALLHERPHEPGQFPRHGATCQWPSKM